MKNKVKAIALGSLAAVITALAFTGCCCMPWCGNKSCDDAKKCCHETDCNRKGMNVNLDAHAGTSGVGMGVSTNGK